MAVTGIDASFYTQLFGAAPAALVPDMFAEWVFAGGEAFGLYKGTEFEPGTGIMFAVPNVAEAVAELKARGVPFHGPIEDTPVCHMAFGTDPEGNGFILHMRK